jgi:hypothetical protein
MRQDVYQLFELVPHGSHELGVFHFILFLQGHCRLDGDGNKDRDERYERDVGSLTFYLTFEEGENAARFKLIGETARCKEITNNLLGIHR